MTAIAPRPEEAPSPAGGDLATRLRLVARGDADAFDAVYDQVAPSVFGIVRRVVGTRPSPESRGCCSGLAERASSTPDGAARPPG